MCTTPMRKRQAACVKRSELVDAAGSQSKVSKAFSTYAHMLEACRVYERHRNSHLLCHRHRGVSVKPAPLMLCPRWTAFPQKPDHGRCCRACTLSPSYTVRNASQNLGYVFFRAPVLVPQASHISRSPSSLQYAECAECSWLASSGWRRRAPAAGASSG